jgi:Cu/Zn superoxide dismutase
MKSKYSGQTNIGAIAVIVLIIAAGVVFTLTRDKEAPAVNTEQPNNSGTTMTSVMFDLLTQNNSGQTGTVTVSDEGGKTKVVVQITPPSSVEQPAHIHSGDCTTPGAVKYPLSNVVNGRSETVLAANMHFIHGQSPLILNVHKSKQESNIYSACGDLTAAFDRAMHTGN